MARITWTDDTGQRCWFEADEADYITEPTTWDGQNLVGDYSGIPDEFGRQSLWRTASGRWVVEDDARRYHDGRQTWRDISGDEARDWLIGCSEDRELAAEWLARYFGPVEPERGRGPGQPQIGPTITLAVPDELLEAAAAEAAAHGISRAAVLRTWLTAGREAVAE